MTTRIYTESGSLYELKDGKVRRAGTHALRRDHEWVVGEPKYEPAVGFPMLIVLEPLGAGDATYRRTTTVTKIEHDN